MHNETIPNAADTADTAPALRGLVGARRLRRELLILAASHV